MDLKYMESLFPAFLEIQDPDLRYKSQLAMQQAMEQGGWTEHNIDTVPVTLNWKECDISWVEHVTDVTEMCILEFDKMKKYYARHNVPFCRDTVIAGALLHDIGKLTEFAPAGENSVVHSDNYHLMRHTAESEFVRTVDIFVFHCCVKGLENSLLEQKNKIF